MTKKKPSLRKPRKVWTINPTSRVKPSDKIYKRQKTKKKEKNWVEELLDW